MQRQGPGAGTGRAPSLRAGESTMLSNILNRLAPTGRQEPSQFASEPHRVSGRSLRPPFPDGCRQAMFGMGCFWGAERMFWQLPGVWVTAVGYAGGHVEAPDYRSVCSGRTGHAETVLVVFDPAEVGYRSLLRVFWEGHDPTQVNRQGNDVGTQYRSLILTEGPDHRAEAEASRDEFAAALAQAGRGGIATGIEEWQTFHYAETCHQQYLARNPGGYCGLGGTGVKMPPHPARS